MEQCSPEPAGYSERLVDELISEVRTDMDAFSDAEIKVLENRGYMMAEAAIRRHAAALCVPDPHPFAVPHPEFLDETKVRRELRDSSKKKLFGRW